MCFRLPEPPQPSLVYRRRAAELEEAAARTKLAASRDCYLRLAEEWRRLAESCEVTSQRWGGPAPAGPPTGEPGTPEQG